MNIASDAARENRGWADPGGAGALDTRAEPRGRRGDEMLTHLALVLTALATVFFVADMWGAVRGNGFGPAWLTGALYGAIVLFLIYGSVSYQFTRLAYLQRSRNHNPVADEALETVYAGPAPSLAILVPSYREEPAVVWQTLLSAALQEYPNRRVVLLIDDPQPCSGADRLALDATFSMVASLRQRLAEIATMLRQQLEDYRQRSNWVSSDPSAEAGNLARLYTEAASWLSHLAYETRVANHTDAFFVRTILTEPSRKHLARARSWRRRAREERHDRQLIAQEYSRLASLFDVELSVFERKRFANLSHEPNKAMNLNSYIGLMGGHYEERSAPAGTVLLASSPHRATLHVPQADYLITLDADSLLLPGYALRLIGLMEQPGNGRLAVAQTPYSAIPQAASLLERSAGATTDIQYLIHQGFTHHGATFWVGANAVLRRSALDDIVEEFEERGHRLKRFIQDRTVIEDTESTVDLIDKGWTLFNYPERLAYSATPPDFGALAVQRGRWANGGLIIFPKLMRYLLRGPDRLGKLREGFFRTHYLTSIAGVNLGLLLLLALSFPAQFGSWWLPLTAVPYYGLYLRDLWRLGYRAPTDILRIYALNMILLPVNIGGVIRSLHQGCARKKIPFLRTPKVAGRTRVPARYLIAIAALTLLCLVNGVVNLMLGAWGKAAFLLGNAAVFIYGTVIFVGLGNALSDLRAACPSLPAALFRRFRGRALPSQEAIQSQAG